MHIYMHAYILHIIMINNDTNPGPFSVLNIICNRNVLLISRFIWSSWGDEVANKFFMYEIKRKIQVNQFINLFDY